eukprot:CAMPEP_0201552450 /NCGR_PEP_ID=MMETSP0173_2-20130828/16529_1 /ASSEMBLY_ACC=CAM_ASM_000268 /TAXON_ID=218659 /ORGANISM="Vexillifera sp., Strain DIVA3 564/2" /LENGTH=148 /DNA_ID=CAMNT_0047962941 /DNA_START=21 /DNA_END=467 /DNA_ORIENTATION=+
MASIFTKVGQYIAKTGGSAADTPKGVEFSEFLGKYIMELPSTWSNFGAELRQFRQDVPNLKMGDVVYNGGFYAMQLGFIGYVGYLIGLGNRTPFSYRLTGWKELSDRVTGWNGQTPSAPPQPYNTEYKNTYRKMLLEKYPQLAKQEDE